MAEYERILEPLKQLLRDANAFSSDFIATFSTLSDINQDYLKFNTEDDSDDHVMEQAFVLVLHSDFIVIKCRVAFFSIVHEELKPVKSKLPERVHPIVEEIERCFKKMDEALKKLDATVQQMKDKIKEIAMRPGKLTDLEDFQLKLLIGELEDGMGEAENHLKQAEKALENLQSELSSYLKKEGILSAVSAVAVAGAAGALAYGASAYYAKTTKTTVSAIKNAAVAGGVVGTGWCAYQIWSLNSLIIGASVGGIYLFFSLKRWFTKRDLYHKLSLIVRNYSDKANESQSILSYQ